MKVSTKGRYGLRAIVDLAVFGMNEHVSLYSIAERQGISPSYLEQVFSTLRKSGLVISVKGSQGGYRLSRNPAQITVKDVITALEGDLSIIDYSDDMDRNDLIKIAINELVWQFLDKKLNDVFQKTTIEDLAEEYKDKNGLNPIMYYI